MKSASCYINPIKFSDRNAVWSLQQYGGLEVGTTNFRPSWQWGDGSMRSRNIVPSVSASSTKLWSSFKGPLNQRFRVRDRKRRGYLARRRNTIEAHSHGHDFTPIRPFQGSGVDEHFLDDVSSFIFRRLHGVLAPRLPENFDLLSWLPMEIHCKLHRSEVMATLLVRECLLFGLDYFLYTMVEGFCRSAWKRTNKLMLGPDNKEMVMDYEQSVFRALQYPLKFTIVVWALTRACFHVAPLFMVRPDIHWVGSTRAVGLTLAGTWFLSNWKGMFVRQLANENKIDAPRIIAVDRVVSLLLYYLALSIVGEITGYGLRSLLAVGGVSSIAVGLAAKEIVSNFFGGTVLLLTRPFVIGERIKAGQFSGQVQDIGFLQTKILGFDKVPVLVPNQAFINQVIVNYSRAQGKLLDAVFTVRNQDIFLVERITTRVIQYLRTHVNVDNGMGAPTCYLKSLGSMGTDIALTCVIPTKTGVDYYQEQQHILVRVAQIIVEEGASLGSNAPFSPEVPSKWHLSPS
eukprot:TRINITY_DN2492_c0_g1_i2.p1 TRINITY_DN2492_c0_g1~~TRINITY_DN2492_c0_g1_i2.p1  ORF type:complete len:515 (-),score=48.03 TRINITY_DN2492_c0_g1_i2:617-2161(-)